MGSGIEAMTSVIGLTDLGQVSERKSYNYLIVNKRIMDFIIQSMTLLIVKQQTQQNDSGNGPMDLVIEWRNRLCGC